MFVIELNALIAALIMATTKLTIHTIIPHMNENIGKMKSFRMVCGPNPKKLATISTTIMMKIVEINPLL
jgi:hypothetical protein